MLNTNVRTSPSPLACSLTLEQIQYQAAAAAAEAAGAALGALKQIGSQGWRAVFKRDMLEP